MGKLLTMKEAAEALMMSERTLRTHIKKGDISYIKIGFGETKPRRLFDEDDLKDFQTRQRKTEWQSTSRRARPTSGMISTIAASGFGAQRAARLLEKQSRKNAASARR